MTLDLDGPALSALSAIALAGIGAVGGVVRHLWLALDAERRGRLEDRAAFTTELKEGARLLREEDARENAELRAKLEAATAPPPSTRSSAPRRKPRP